jgi:hypothetical protein
VSLAVPALVSVGTTSGVTPVVIDALLQLNALADVAPSGRVGRNRR